MAPAAQPPEVQFAQRLAANEKRVRDRALKKLRGYLALRTRSPASSFSQEEWLKIWKGLFYCMWMQDKPLFQEELSNNIAQLTHVIENTDAWHLFIQTFWQTMNREWHGIDNLRLDKFYMLIRMVLRQSFEVLKRNEWNESITEPFLKLLMKEVIHPDSQAPIGIKMHFIDIYLEELAKVGAKELTADQNLRFIEPFCKIVAKTKDRLLLKVIIRGIFETILDQSPFAIEDLMKELKERSDDDLSEEDESNEGEKPVKDADLPSKHSLDSKAPDNILEDADYNIGPVLQFDYKTVGDTLFEWASRKNTPAFNRKQLYKVVKKFQNLGEGIFPQNGFPEDVSTDEDDDTFSRRKWKRKSGKPLDKTQPEKDDCARNAKNGIEESPGPQKKKKKRKRKSSQMVDSGIAAECNEKGLVPEKGSKEPNQDSESLHGKKRPKKSLSMEVREMDPSAAPTVDDSGDSVLKTLTCLVNSIKKQPKKKNGSLQKVSIEFTHQNGQAHISMEKDPSYCAAVACGRKAMKRKRKAETGTILGSSFSEEAVEQPKKENMTESGCPVPRKVKLKKKQNLVMIRCSRQKIISLRKKKKIKEVLSSVEEAVTEVENKKSKSNETGGTAVLQKNKKAKTGNDFVKFEKTTLPKPVFFRKAKGSISPMQLSKLQSSNSKKVTFGLSKNMTAEFKTTDKSILVTPEGASRVAFNPEQKPSHGVLKSPASSSAETTPQIKKSLLTPAKKRPTAIDFF